MQTAFEDLAARGYEYAFNLSASSITFLASLALGWKSIGSMEPVALTCKPHSRGPDVRKIASRLPLIWRLANRLPSLYFMKRAQPFFWLDGAQTRHGCLGNSRIIVSKTPDPEAMAELMKRLDYDGRLRHMRDKEYFSWRFKNPMREYRFLFRKEGLLKGYLVLQRNLPDNRSTGRVNLVDWEADSVPILK